MNFRVEKNVILSIKAFIILSFLLIIGSAMGAPSGEIQEDNALSNFNSAETEHQRSDKIGVSAYLLNNYLNSLAKIDHIPENNYHSSNRLSGLEDEDEDYLNSESDEQNEEVLPSLQKRSRTYLSKKESPDQRNKDFRRQQAARWDIGFGKRGYNKMPNKAFLDALYGKRSNNKNVSPKIAFGRKQQWDIQYGRR